VVPAVERLAALEGIGEEDCRLLRLAAIYHDLGFIEQYTGHEYVGMRIAGEVLPDFGFGSAQVATIANIILATKLPQSPHNILEEIMADADLDVFGRDDFFIRNQALRTELASYGRPTSDVEWYTGQLKFLQEHEYFTAAARQLRGPTKQRNLEELAERLRRLSVVT
jgi:predicted metal-dependent HD superfamily phosphohydrolase